ncbi:septum formation family protein [Lysinibacter cavernae]|uniref:Septum formation-related domain-containing protein n=1 Tax=Lysinibacter cavernae TaxID=1640652 RepID=A0A7X5TTZ6_9MICO|nr:septum formation family protein [Lysinibacter cavernae]NIH55146.1 hypothetical protein [Lysinibacter cavernae]
MTSRFRIIPPVTLVIGMLLVAGCTAQLGGLRDGSGTVVSEGEENALALAVGDCFTESDADTSASNQPATVPLVPCDTPHESEVFYNHIVESEAFPGADTLNSMAQDVCSTEFATFTGIPFSDSELQLTFYTPTERTWTAGSDRVINCIVVDPVTVTGSLQNANR